MGHHGYGGGQQHCGDEVRPKLARDSVHVEHQLEPSPGKYFIF
jgi:hypothetical protein